jgi:hypothetical protein
MSGSGHQSPPGISIDASRFLTSKINIMDSSTPFIQSGLASSLRQPATIAAIASVGIHALFAVNIEKISLFTPTAQLPPSVELVELSADQVGGIYPPPPPQFGLSEFTPPPSLSSILGGGPTIPAFPSSPPPPSPTFTTPQQEFVPFDPSVGTTGRILPPIGSSSNPPWLDGNSDPSSDRNPDYNSGVPSGNSSPSGSNQFMEDFLQKGYSYSQDGEDGFRDKNAEEFERWKVGQDVYNGEDPPIFPPDPDPANVLNPDQTSPDEPGNKPPAVSARKGFDDLASADLDEEPSQPSSPDGRGLLIAKLEGSNNPSPQPGPQTNNRIDPLSDLYKWVLGLKDSRYPDIEDPERISISDVYPVEACDQKLSGDVLVGVVVGSGGEILAGPELFLKTGYPVLDNEAVQKVREFVNNEPLGRDKPTAYQYAFEFNSENCGNVSSPEEVPPQVTPGNSQEIEKNSTSGVTEFEDDVEDAMGEAPVEEQEVTPPAPIDEAPVEEQEVTPPAPIDEAPLEEQEVTPPAPIDEAPVEEQEVTPPAPIDEAPLKMEQPLEN